MSRVKRGVTSHARHKAVLKQAKGYYGRRKNSIRIARQAVEKAGQYAYRDRRTKKRNFRSLWVQRINAAVREHGLTYGRFIDGLNKAGVLIDRKVLSDLAITDPGSFAALVARARSALSAELQTAWNFADLTVPELLALANILLRIAEEIPKEDRKATREARDEIAYVLRLIADKEDMAKPRRADCLH